MKTSKFYRFVWLACSLAGCGPTLDRPDPIDGIAAATGFADAVRFEIEGAPVDLPSDTPASLSLSQALRRALGTDPRLQASLSRFRQALADADQARLLPNPVLNLTMRYPEAGGTPLIEVGGVADVMRVFQAPWRAGAAEKRLRSAAAETVSTALEVVTELRKTYVDIQAVDRTVGILEEQQKALDRLVAVARKRLELGEGTRTDLTTFQAREAEILVELADRRLERRVARLKLTRLMGRPSSEPDSELEPWTAPEPPGLSEAAWVEAALFTHPEIEARAWELAALRDEKALARFAPFTDAEAGASAEREEGAWGVGPVMSSILPIFDFGTARREKARAKLAEARHQLTLARRAVVEDVRRAYTTLSSARENLSRVRSELLPAQTERYQRIREAYLAGEIGATELYLAEQDLRSAQSKLVYFERSLIIALDDLRRAAGGPAAGITQGESQAHADDSGLMEDN